MGGGSRFPSPFFSSCLHRRAPHMRRRQVKLKGLTPVEYRGQALREAA